MNRKMVVEIRELPLRPRQLRDEELTEIFGGCLGKGSWCYKDTDCCTNSCTESMCTENVLQKQQQMMQMMSQISYSLYQAETAVKRDIGG